MTRAHARTCIAAAALLCGAHVSAQQQQPASQEQPVFRSGVHLIEVDVRVFDGDGRFVTDLTPEDFEIVEKGTPQKIESLFLVRSGTATAAEVTSAAAPETPTAPPAAAPSSARQTWIVVFDTNHLVPGAGFDRAREAVREFLRTRFKDGDVGGIVANGRMINNRLTSVREELVAAAESVKPNADLRSLQIDLTREWPRFQDEWEAIQVANENKDALDRAVTRACTDDPSACKNVPPDLAVRQKARRLQAALEQATRATLNTINALASGLAKVAGPKTVVFLTQGFVTERMETSLQQAVGQTARAGGRIYAIDVRGLNRGRGAGIIDQQYASDEAGGTAQFDMGADGPNSLAADTGGLMIRNENNIGRALDTIADDAGTCYVLAYRPTDQSFDGKYRPIEVRVNRPGVHVRARKGYLAVEPARLLTPRPITPPADPRDDAAPVDAETPPTTPALPAVEPLPSITAGKVVEGAASTDPDHLRMRPDAIDRVREIAGTDETTKGADSLAAKGWAAYERGDVETAAAAFIEAADHPGVRPWVLYALGLSHTALARPAEAAAAWERVRSRAPEFSEVYVDLADAYLQLSEESKALAVLREGSTRWPQDPEFHNAIGVLYVRRGAFDEGIASFEKAAAAAPDDPLAYFNLGRAYQMRHARDTRYVASQRRWVSPEADRKKAIEYYQQYLKLGGPYVNQAQEAIRLLEWARR